MKGYLTLVLCLISFQLFAIDFSQQFQCYGPPAVSFPDMVEIGKIDDREHRNIRIGDREGSRTLLVDATCAQTEEQYHCEWGFGRDLKLDLTEISETDEFYKLVGTIRHTPRLSLTFVRCFVGK